MRKDQEHPFVAPQWPAPASPAWRLLSALKLLTVFFPSML